MKRGLIAWDKLAIPPAAFEARLDVVRKVLMDSDLSALVVYTDVSKSNQVRYFSNFMPYWNRALLVIPREGAPVLLCALSPRVYPWIRSVTIIEDIRPAANLPQQLQQMCQEKGWKRVGVLDLAQMPHDLYVGIRGGDLDITDVPWNSVHPRQDDAELTLYRKSAKLARETLETELPGSVGLVDRQFVGRLERKLRRAGAEDVMILVSNGETAPVPAEGEVLRREFSVSLTLEYCGHWVKVSRAHASPSVLRELRNRFDHALKPSAGKNSMSPVYIDSLSGPYPYECCNLADVNDGSLFGLHVETQINGTRLFYGDTCLQGKNGAELL
jgi:hypothetical protein